MKLLKQSTAVTLLLGPFLDETDGQTAETGLTISQADVLLWKEGGTTLAQKNESTSCTHRSNGLYTCPLDTTDTNTLGILTVSVDEGGALPIRQDYRVVTAAMYDLLHGSAMVESYNADGTAPTITQALLGSLQNSTEFTISGTTKTVKKLDGSTTAMTLTLNDSANPTGITRTG